MSNQTAKKTGGSRFSTSLVVGLLLVPLSAVAAVALVNPDATAEPDEVAVVAVAEATTTTTVAEEIVVPEIASTDDLELACGEQGLALVTKELDATISPLEQAALDSLRAICVAEGMELPGPPAPEAIVETVTVVAAPAATGGGTDTATDTATDTVDGVDEAAAEFEAEYAATVAHINKAIADGAGGEKIAKAERLVGEAAALADAGNYGDGMNTLAEARQAADEADRRHGDDDDDDDEDEEDEHDEHEDDGEDEKGDH